MCITTPSFLFFWDGNFLPGMALNLGPHDLCLQGRQNLGYLPLCPSFSFSAFNAFCSVGFFSLVPWKIIHVYLLFSFFSFLFFLFFLPHLPTTPSICPFLLLLISLTLLPFLHSPLCLPFVSLCLPQFFFLISFLQELSLKLSWIFVWV
jgi:hypothetical protein